MLYFQSVRIHTRRDSRRKSLSLTIGARRYLLDEIREFLASDPEIDGGATILSCGDLAVRIFGLRAQAAANGGKNKSAYEKIFYNCLFKSFTFSLRQISQKKCQNKGMTTSSECDKITSF